MIYLSKGECTMNDKNFSYHLTLNDTKIRDEFWCNILEKVRTKVIPYQYEALNDRIENTERSYCIDNFKKAAKIVEEIKRGNKVPVYPVDKWMYDDKNCDKNAFHGWVFQDSDAYKWIEAVAYSLVIEYDEKLKEKADKLIDLIASAQLENGYIDTLYIINNREKIFTNLRDFHELYCFGHLAEAGVAYYYSTENDKLLNCALRFADLICDTFGENKNIGYPGHEIAELALIKLYEVTQNKKYLDAACFFINQRGKKPYYFDLEHNVHSKGENYFYNQAHKPPREQTEALGHAVRGVYLYSGMADVAKYCGDDELYSACKSIWNNIYSKKMYITGGIGSTADGEAFSFDYDLPNDLAYCETCASIGLIFFARRMLEIEADCSIADTVERALYNTVLSGMNENGDRFFYVNPLEVLPIASKKDSRKNHIKTIRQKWFGCACCPPNIARLLMSLAEYCYTQNNTTVFVHQYIGSEVETYFGTIKQYGNYSENGRISLSIKCIKPFTIALRIPSWCDNYQFSENYKIRNGYAYFQINNDTAINATFEIKPRFVKCSNMVRENVGKLALCYGPKVYCMEEKDNGNNLQMLKVDINTVPVYDKGVIIADGYREIPDKNLYSNYTPAQYKKCKIKFIEYRKWGNRGENEMSVYFRY